MKKLLIGAIALLSCSFTYASQEEPNYGEKAYEWATNVAPEVFKKYEMDKGVDFAVETGKSIFDTGKGLALGTKDAVISPDSICRRMEANYEEVRNNPLFSSNARNMIDKAVKANKPEALMLAPQLGFITKQTNYSLNNILRFSIYEENVNVYEVAERAYNFWQKDLPREKDGYRCGLDVAIGERHNRSPSADKVRTNSFHYAFDAYLRLLEVAGYEGAVDEGYTFVNKLEAKRPY